MVFGYRIVVVAKLIVLLGCLFPGALVRERRLVWWLAFLCVPNGVSRLLGFSVLTPGYMR